MPKLEKSEIIRDLLFLEDLGKYDMSGAFFKRKTVYFTNGALLGRIKQENHVKVFDAVLDPFSDYELNPMKYYSDRQENLRINWEANPIPQFDSILDERVDNFFFIKKEFLFNPLNGKFKGDKLKSDITLSLSSDGKSNNIEVKALSKKGKVITEYTIYPFLNFIKNQVIGEFLCEVNLLFLQRIIANNFSFCDIIGIKLSSAPNSPLIIFGRNKNEKSEIQWALGQHRINRIPYKK